MYRKWFQILLLPALALFLTGCGASQADIERDVKKGIEEKLHVKVSSLTLHKDSPDKYTGTAVLTNGENYEVQVDIKAGGMMEWRAQPDQAGIEKQMKKLIEDTYHTPIQSIQLVKAKDGNYTGEATLASGQRLTLTATWEGFQMMLRAVPVGGRP